MFLGSSKGGPGIPRHTPVNALVLFVALVAGASLLISAAVARAAPPTVVASFSYSPALPVSNQTVVFNSTSTASGSNNQIATQAWDLDGDNQFDDALGPTAFRAFPRPGSFTVGLHVTDTHDGEATAVNTVTVNALPSATFVYSSSPVAGDPVYFFSTSSDADGFIKSQAWDLDNDGQFDDGTSALASRTFGTPGHYTVWLRVVDNGGASSTAGAGVVVADPSEPIVVVPAGTLAAGLKLLSPFPVVRVSGVVTRAGMRLRLLTVSAPEGARIRIRCRRRGCPFRRRSRLVESRSGIASGRARVSKVIRFRRFRGRLLRPGATVQVFVTKPGTIGKYTRLRVRRGRVPARADRCLVPGASRPVRCPPS